MGLFSAVGTQKQAKPVRAYLDQRAKVTLSRAGWAEAMQLRVEADRLVVSERLEPRQYRCLRQSDAEDIPKSIPSIHAVELFEAAAKKGSGLAWFYLAIFHDFGLFTPLDRDRASEFYRLAAGAPDPAKPLVDAVAYVKAHMYLHPELAFDPLEDLAVNLWSASWEENRNYQPVREILGSDFYRDMFLHAGSYLTARYALDERRVYARGLFAAGMIDYLFMIQNHRLTRFAVELRAEAAGHVLLQSVYTEAMAGNHAAQTICQMIPKN